MTNHGPRKVVDAVHSSARLLQAREFRESARSLVMLGQSKSYNGAITLMVTAAIAYDDAVTAKAKGVVNKQDHLSAPKLLRDCWATACPTSRRSSSASCSAVRTKSTMALEVQRSKSTTAAGRIGVMV